VQDAQKRRLRRLRGGLGPAGGKGERVCMAYPHQSWRLIPILATPNNPAGFDQGVRKLLRSVASPKYLFGGFGGRQVASLRNSLARLYRKHWGSTNQSSLMILLVPCHPGGSAGWLCTGDVNLTDSFVQASLRQHGVRWFPSVDAVHVPHHGSPKNLNSAAASFLQGLVGATQLNWVVSSGKNRWNYPSAIRPILRPHLVETTASSEWSNVLRF